MRRFDYTAYATPDDPSKQRQTSHGKIRTEATTRRGVAAAFVSLDRAALAKVPDTLLSSNVTQNAFQFDYRTDHPYPSCVHVELHEVAEGPVHFLTPDGFVAWAEHQVRERPIVNDQPNTVERELAAFLHEQHLQQLYHDDSSELLDLLAGILMDGHRGYAQMTREELLERIDAEIIQQADDEMTTVEDIACYHCPP